MRCFKHTCASIIYDIFNAACKTSEGHILLLLTWCCKERCTRDPACIRDPASVSKNDFEHQHQEPAASGPNSHWERSYNLRIYDTVHTLCSEIFAQRTDFA